MVPRILVCEFDCDLGVAARGKVRIMVASNCLPSEDVDLMRSIAAQMPAAIKTITSECVREITHVEKRVPLKP